MKSLVIPVIWLALSSVIYWRITPCFALNHILNRIISVLTCTIFAQYRTISVSNTKMEYDVKTFLLPLPSTRKSQKIAETKIRYQLRKGTLGSPKSSHITYHLDVCVIRYVWYRDNAVIIWSTNKPRYYTSILTYG